MKNDYETNLKRWHKKLFVLAMIMIGVIMVVRLIAWLIGLVV